MARSKKSDFPAYESKDAPLLPLDRFLQRMAKSAAAILALIVFSLMIGIAGYRLTEHMGWIDALLNASMILSGMGPAGDLHSAGGKIFASVYALYSGLFLIAVSGALLLPVLHRMMHKFHMQNKD